MARQLVEVGVLGLMAASAHLDLRRSLSHRILYRVQRMATGTGHVVRGMRARRPIMGGIGLMTGQALRVLFGCGGLRFFAEIHHALERPAAAIHMRAAGPVARFALQPAMAEGAVRIIRTSMLRAKDVRDVRLGVTDQAGVCSRLAVMRRGGSCRR